MSLLLFPWAHANIAKVVYRLDNAWELMVGAHEKYNPTHNHYSHRI
jgi:hypothetical protein